MKYIIKIQSFYYICSKLILLKKEDLQELLKKVKEGNQKAQTKLINYFWEDVSGFILKKVQDKVTADELTVVVFTKVLAKLDLYDENFEFKTWILTITQNSGIDYWRKESKKETLTENLAEVKNEFEKSPEELLISKQQQQRIISTIASMDSNYRKILELRFFEEKSIKEIAETLNISVANTKVRIMRAKKILAELLKNE